MKNLPQLFAEHFDDPYHRGPCELATHAAQAACPESGCAVRIELRITPDGCLQEAWFEADGCDTCEAWASLMLEQVEGSTSELAQQLTDERLLLEVAGAELGSSGPRLQLPDVSVCFGLPLQVLKQALTQSLDGEDDEMGSPFGGPSLREEC